MSSDSAGRRARAFQPREEAARMEDLRSYAVLDTPPEAGFDDMTMLAAYICQAPIALVTLVDDDRQWFKSRVGLDLTETPRDVAFCAHAILQPDLFIVHDAMNDRRFADNPLVTGHPHIRFYAGAPLVNADGHALGTLCAIDRVPRTLSAEQETALAALSRQVMTLLDLRRTSAQLSLVQGRAKVLGGLLPICATCKKFRDDHGYWAQVEQYVQEHAGTDLAHGICPDCARRLHGEEASHQ